MQVTQTKGTDISIDVSGIHQSHIIAFHGQTIKDASTRSTSTSGRG